MNKLEFAIFKCIAKIYDETGREADYTTLLKTLESDFPYIAASHDISTIKRAARKMAEEGLLFRVEDGCYVPANWLRPQRKIVAQATLMEVI